MTTWYYKATESKIPKLDTMMLAELDGFLCRSLYTAGLASAPLVREVDIGDTVHFYYRVHGRPLDAIGSFEVIEKGIHPHPDRFGDRVEDTALYAVLNPTFVEGRDKRGGYAPDPKLGSYTGWLIRKLGPAPTCSDDFAAGRDTLARG